jgi:ElaB/YqjD/DUF883 family membrane-anchored ribosome-binding protein
MTGRAPGDDLVGRAAGESLREGMPEDAVRARQTGEAPDETRRVRTEIERTRGDMSETIDEIQARLSPRHLASQARDTLKEKTVDRVRSLADNAGQGVSDLAFRTREAARDTVGPNPWPAIMIGVGAAWLLFDRRGRSHRDGPVTERQYHPDGTTGYYEVAGGADAAAAGDAWTSTSGSTAASGRSREPYYRGSAWRDESSGRGVAQSSRQALDRARSGLSDFSTQAGHLMQRNPLVVGAVAAAVGVAVGLALPETERENRLMGETRDTLIDRAQGAAHDAVEKVKEKAESATKLL